MSEVIVKFNNYMTQHTDKVPLLSVQSIDDKRFTVLRDLLNSVFDDVEDNAWSVSTNLGKFVDALSTMEQRDLDTISRTVKKYQIKALRVVSQVREPMGMTEVVLTVR